MQKQTPNVQFFEGRGGILPECGAIQDAIGNSFFYLEVHPGFPPTPCPLSNLIFSWVAFFVVFVALSFDPKKVNKDCIKTNLGGRGTVRSVAQTYLRPKLGPSFRIFVICRPNFGPTDISSWENIQLFT